MDFSINAFKTPVAPSAPGSMLLAPKPTPAPTLDKYGASNFVPFASVEAPTSGVTVTPISTGASTATTAAQTSQAANVNWTNVGIGMQLAGNLYSTFASYNNSKAMAASYKAQAGDILTAANTQVMFEKLNNDLLQEAYSNSRLQLLREQRAQMGALRVAFSGEGIEMSGSAREVMAEQGRIHAEDLYNLDRNSQIASFQSQLRSEHTLLTASYQASALRIRAKYAKKAAKRNLVAGLTQAIGSAAFSYGMAI